jgi:hypothetical protein
LDSSTIGSVGQLFDHCWEIICSRIAIADEEYPQWGGAIIFCKCCGLRKEK